jgi:response regulator RpfG family c-di-GMP phosphodiesterase
MNTPSIFVVDDEPQIVALLARILEREGHAVRTFGSAQAALDALPAERPVLIVTDLMMPGMSGAELVQRARQAVPGIAAIVTSGFASVDNVRDAMHAGANDFIGKPFSVTDIRDVVARVLAGGAPVPVQAADEPADAVAPRAPEPDVAVALERLAAAEEAYVASLCDVVAATEERCPWFARHSERVRELSVALGRRMGLAQADIDVLDTAARLLDIGRVETPDELLDKPARPSSDEWEVLRRHAVRGSEVLRPVGRLRQVQPLIRHHHENWDGTGYPDGLAGDDIPLLASIVRIADSFAALTSPRAWRPAMEGDAAVREIVGLAGRHFHPQLAAAFAEMQLSGGGAEERQ